VDSVPGQAVLFGFPPTEVEAEVIPRTRRWRLSGAVRAVLVSLVVAPVVAVVPPHAPWALGALGAGAFFGRRRWMETHTLRSIHGACPKCGQPFRARSSRLRTPHPLQCEGCHHVSELRLSVDAL
jgi:MYXO-CTERM domain-containing protein